MLNLWSTLVEHIGTMRQSIILAMKGYGLGCDVNYPKTKPGAVLGEVLFLYLIYVCIQLCVRFLHVCVCV